MHRIYIIISYLAAPLVALLLFWKGLGNRAYWERFEERFGFGRSRLASPGIWVHAVSVGEVVAASSLIARLRERYPDYPVVVTTVTPTGAQRVRDLFGDDVLHSYAPYDTIGSVRRFFDRMQPRLAIVMETELWPNLYAACGARGIPLVLANARISPRSVQRYRRFIGLFRQALANGIVIAAQSAQDAERFLSLGANPERTFVTGNLKADVALPPGLAEAGKAFRRDCAAGRPVWVAASTHAGEEEAVLEAHARVRRALPDSLLLLVPRHPYRFAEVAALLESRGEPHGRRSTGQTPAASDPVYLVDSLGELPMFYAAADVAFVGGSLVPIGGHNLLEPAALAIPVLTGPHNFNAEDIAALLLAAGALEVVDDQQQLARVVTGLLLDPAGRQARGACAKRVVADSGGALERLLALIRPLLPEGPGR
ncbi:lipid IV(A) 3-deoxy-D-manno-octulosonic acid transferase [Wenzhouxiangella sp. XN24]|uniref:lipid IV(A) 3-deoxy-D-manno-octulosonic acid transferase n=1 Tax=Wenzhouxiangella sp. XN24 TaxID=2713569 RepID=UPI0013E9D581|nr:lipid IV(A) 3-deoxy-D-manno-octulosonic acid transferase [Wenzhouxiangella sp. XN24]NGX15157.1 3-deoxy-D-manno-octulosonic acid transferase [Wenzhouxiangella sp. XN24]